MSALLAMRPSLRIVCALSLCVGAFGCSSTTSPNVWSFPSAGSSSGGANAEGGASAGTSAGGIGNAAGAASAAGGGANGGTGGVTSSAGSAGSAQGGSAGAGGTGGSSLPGGCVEAGTPGKTGRQCDPGKDGNGTSDEMLPASDTPPEGVGVAKGTVLAAASYSSVIYGYDFIYQVFVPVQYVAGKPAALMIFQDGGNYLVNFHTPKVIETLIDAKAMPVTIGVFINPGNDRSKEYDSIDDKYVRFLTEELIPQRIAPKYDLVDDPNGWAIGGHSSGGSAAFTAGWQKPDVFRKILTNSGSFVNLQGGSSAGTYPTLVAGISPAKPLRISMSSGSSDLGGWRAANDTMAAALDKAGYPYHYVKNGGPHDPIPWATADYANVLRWLWRGYSLPQYAN